VLGQRYMSVVDMVRMLDRARNDPRVLGLVCHIASDFEPTLAQAQELSAAITRVRALAWRRLQSARRSPLRAVHLAARRELCAARGREAEED
jgi:hypothetical protein